jgi:hypothetical protein
VAVSRERGGVWCERDTRRAGAGLPVARQGRGAWRGQDTRRPSEARRARRGRDSRVGGRRAPWPKSWAGARFGGGRPPSILKD